MDIAIIGLPQSGKTTIFNALTAGNSTSSGAGGAGPMQVGVVKVIDPRLAVLNDIYHPKKVIHPEIKYWDLPPSDRESASSNQILSGRQRNILQAADALFLVVRTFEKAWSSARRKTRGRGLGVQVRRPGRPACAF